MILTLGSTFASGLIDDAKRRLAARGDQDQRRAHEFSAIAILDSTLGQMPSPFSSAALA